MYLYILSVTELKFNYQYLKLVNNAQQISVNLFL